MVAIENYIFEKTEEYLDDMYHDHNLITEKNLSGFSHFCAKYAYHNYRHKSADYYEWIFDKPWGGKWDN